MDINGYICICLLIALFVKNKIFLVNIESISGYANSIKNPVKNASSSGRGLAHKKTNRLQQV